MLVLHPKLVRFAQFEWGDVETVAIDRTADRLVVDFDDLGPNVVFADVPERRVTIKIVRVPQVGDIDPVIPGDMSDVQIDIAPAQSDVANRTLSATCVVTSVRTDVASPKGPRQTIALIAVASGGDVDPVVVSTPDAVASKSEAK